MKREISAALWAHEAREAMWFKLQLIIVEFSIAVKNVFQLHLQLQIFLFSSYLRTETEVQTSVAQVSTFNSLMYSLSLTPF